MKFVNKLFVKIQRYFFNMKLQRKLLISYLLCILIPLSIIGAPFYVESAKRIMSERCDAANQAVKQYNKIFDEYIRQVDSITLLPYINKDLQKYLLKTTDLHIYNNIDITSKEAFSVLESQFQVNRTIDCVSIASLNGQILSQSKYGRVKAEYEFINNPFYNDFFSSTGEITISPLHSPSYMFSPTYPAVTVGRKILDFKEGFYSGYILVDCSTDIFKKACTKVTVGKDEYILICDKKGNLLYSSRDFNQQSEQSILNKIKSEKSGDAVKTIEGEKVIVASDTSDYTGWQVYSIQPYSKIFKGVEPIRDTFVFLMFGCTALGIICSLAISKSITGPLDRLQKTMLEIQQGNTEIRAKVENSSEVGQFSACFNKLLDRIEYLLTSIKSIELKKREAELDALISKIKPHFLYNTLESIRMMAVIEDKKQIAHAIEALADLFRYTIRIKKDIIDIETELDYIKNYIYLQKIRYSDNLQVIYDVDETLMTHKIIKLTLQPIVENALKHGIDKNYGKGIIKISVKSSENCLLISVIDDGLGMTAEQLQKIKDSLENSEDENSQSIGLKNIQERVHLYFGNKYGLQIESRLNKGTKVTLKIPDYQDEEKVLKNAVSISNRR